MAALERKWNTVPAQLLTANGTTLGVVTVASTYGFKTKQTAFLQNTTSSITVQIKRVLSHTKMIVGYVDQRISSWKPLDISAYTIASGASIGAEEQNKNNIPSDDHYSAIYESDPIVADRVILVDKFGDLFGDDNPLPIAFDGTVTVGNVTIQDDDGDELEINVDGSINVNQTQPILDPFIANVPIVTANTEYNFLFPANTKKFLIRVRSGLAKTQLAFVSGDTGTLFVTLNAGCVYIEDVNVAGKTIYFQTNKASEIMEILYWTKP